MGASVSLLAQAPGSRAATTRARPNIVVILTHDQGYGDVSAYNPAGKIPTPHIDRLAREGLRFTDAHTGSSVCTPTRYGPLTGRERRLAQGQVHHAGIGAASQQRAGAAAVQGLPPLQLYHLDADPKETTNLQAAHPDVVRRLDVILEDYQRTSRSR